MNRTPNPFESRGVRDYLLPEHLDGGPAPRTDGYLPEQDSTMLGDIAPEGWDRINSNPYAAITAAESDAVVQTGADRDRIVRDVVYSDPALTTELIASDRGLTAQDVLAAEQERHMRAMGLMPDDTDPMGPEPKR